MQSYIRLLGLHLCSEARFGLRSNTTLFIRKCNIRYLGPTATLNALNVSSFSRPKRNSFNVDDLLTHINSGKEFYLKQLTNVFHTIDFNKLNPEEAKLLLQHCGSVVVDSSKEQRNSVCRDLFNGLRKANNVNTEILNTYIKTSTENGSLVDYKEMLLKFEPNGDSFKLLLENACQLERIGDAFIILEVMKKKEIPLDRESINSLILAHAVQGGLKAAETVLSTIRTAHISENNSSILALYKGLIRRKDAKEFDKAIEDYPLSVSEEELLVLIEELGLNGLEDWLTKLYDYYKLIPITREIQLKIHNICIHLIHMGQPISAINIYEKFVEPHPDTQFGFPILKEMLHTYTDIDIIISLAKSLVERELSPYILESLTEIALKYNYEEEAWTFLKNLHEVRPHYFWPLFIHHGKNRREEGVFYVLHRTKEFNVKLDSETLEKYMYSFCKVNNYRLLISKLQEHGFTVRELLSPLLNHLLRRNKIEEATTLSMSYKVPIYGENFLQLLAKAWVVTMESDRTCTLLARYCESNSTVGQDFVGSFLICAAKACRNLIDFQASLQLMKMIASKQLRMNTQSAEMLQEISKQFLNEKTQSEFDNNMHSLVDIGLSMAETPFIPHPRSMDMDALECHLIELREKKMETRGVLRRLIQMHANAGHVERVKELRKLFLESGYEESFGIKSSIMHSYVQGGHVDEAMNLYNEIKAFGPDFQIDNFKLIDLAKLLIENDRFEDGYNILKNESQSMKAIHNVNYILRNCKELLNACKTADQLEKMFNHLTQHGFCRVTNVILGPLVRIHLKSGNIEKAVETYIQLAKKHRCTPLQFELLTILSKQKNEDQLDRVLRATESVHGLAATQVGLIAALAENGQETSLKKALANTNCFIDKLLEKRCLRWVEEKKIEPLKCLARVGGRFLQKFFDVDFVHKCILDLYEINNDLDGAVTFFDGLPDDVRSESLEQRLYDLRNQQKLYSKKVVNK